MIWFEEPLAPSLKDSLGGLDSLSRLCRILTILEREWGSLVGEKLAERTRLLAYNDGVLEVAAENAATRHDFNFKKSRVLEAAHRRFGLPLRDIRVEVCTIRPAVREAVPEASVKARPLPPPDPEQVDLAREEIIASCPDLSPQLVESLARIRVMCDR